VYLYKNCSDLPISNFDIIYKTNDFKYLVVGYNGYDEIEVPKGAEERWNAIKEQWIEVLGDNTVAYKYQLVLEINYLQARYNIVQQILGLMLELIMDDETFDQYINMLKGWGYNYNKENKRSDELLKMIRQHKVSENKINNKLAEYKTLTKDDNLDEIETLEKQAVVLAQVLGRNNINLKETSVLEWLELTKLAKEINKQREKANGK